MRTMAKPCEDTNIRSAKKLRIQFDRLWEQMPAARRPGGSAATVAPIDPSAASPAAVQRWEPALARRRRLSRMAGRPAGLGHDCGGRS